MLAGIPLVGCWGGRQQERPTVSEETTIAEPVGPGSAAPGPGVQAGPTNFPGLLADAAALKQEAVAVAKQVAEAYPEDALGYALLGSAFYNTGQAEEAVRHLRRCLELNPEQAEAYEILARIAYEKGELEESARLGEESLRRGGTGAEVLNQLGRTWLDLGRTSEAKAVLEQATELPRPYSESYYLLGQAHLQSGDAHEAKSSFLRAVALLPDHTQAYFGLFTACQRLGQTEEAARYRERFLALEAIDRQHLTDRRAREATLSGLPLVRETVARTLFGAGQIYGSHQQQAKAAEFTLKAALLDEDALLYRATLEAMFVRRNAPAHGVRLFEQLAAAQPENGLNYFFLGRLHERLQQVEAAETAYRRVQELAPGWPGGYRALAELYLRLDREPDKARQLASRAVELEPTAQHHYLLGVACSRTKDRAGAIQAVQRAMALNPDEPRYRAFLEQLERAP